jgi:hypothetical protein
LKAPADYLDEIHWRFNGRKPPDPVRDTMLALIRPSNLPYSKSVNYPQSV